MQSTSTAQTIFNNVVIDEYAQNITPLVEIKEKPKQGADFIAVNGDNMIKVQLKGRFTLDKKYLGKDIYVAFIENEVIKIYKHDDAILILPENILTSKSWAPQDGSYSWGKTPKLYDKIIKEI